MQKGDKPTINPALKYPLALSLSKNAFPIPRLRYGASVPGAADPGSIRACLPSVSAGDTEKGRLVGSD